MKEELRLVPDIVRCWGLGPWGSGAWSLGFRDRTERKVICHGGMTLVKALMVDLKGLVCPFKNSCYEWAQYLL
jgi:hypothetical protein